MSPAELPDLARHWLACFGKQSEGINVDQYLWHVFSSGCFPSLSGQGALEAYTLQEAAEYVVVSNDRRTGFVTNVRPGPSSLSDWLIFPPNLAWTMTFTHEDGWLGPYFARNPDHMRLDAENKALLRKVAEAAMARQNDWT